MEEESEEENSNDNCEYKNSNDNDSDNELLNIKKKKIETPVKIQKIKTINKIEIPFQLRMKFLLNQNEYLTIISNFDKLYHFFFLFLILFFSLTDFLNYVFNVSNIMNIYEVIVSLSEDDYYPETISSILSIHGDPIKVKKAVNDIFVNLNKVFISILYK